MVENNQFISETEDNLFPLKKTLQIKGKLHYLSEPWIMGIINITPDSFYKHSRMQGQGKEVLVKSESMLTEGAKILDIGGYSTRPGADDISEDEELKRVIPVIISIKREFPDSIISVDTFRQCVAKEAIYAGADMVNDISGGDLDNRMITSVGELKVPFICMHMRGNPSNMQTLTRYDHLEKEILEYFCTKVKKCYKAGIKDVIIDVGLGFSKTLEQNFKIIKNLSYFKSMNLPLLVGVSRKSMIHKLLGISPEEALNGTTALHMAVLIQGANILRVHDVKEAAETVKIYKQIYT